MENLVDAGTRELGHSGIAVGPLAFGCWRFTHEHIRDARTALDAALENGMHLVDTADVYGLDWGGTGFGACETLLGAVLKDAPELRDQMVLATKGGIPAAMRLLSRLDDTTGAAIRAQSLDSRSAGVRRQAELRSDATDDGYIEENLWTGIGRARSGCGAAIVGDPDQVKAKLAAYRALGIDTFILSGYPHLNEAERFGRLVLGQRAEREAS